MNAAPRSDFVLPYLNTEKVFILMFITTKKVRVNDKLLTYKQLRLMMVLLYELNY